MDTVTPVYPIGGRRPAPPTVRAMQVPSLYSVSRHLANYGYVSYLLGSPLREFETARVHLLSGRTAAGPLTWHLNGVGNVRRHEGDSEGEFLCASFFLLILNINFESCFLLCLFKFILFYFCYKVT